MPTKIFFAVCGIVFFNIMFWAGVLVGDGTLTWNQGAILFGIAVFGGLYSVFGFDDDVNLA